MRREKTPLAHLSQLQSRAQHVQSAKHRKRPRRPEPRLPKGQRDPLRQNDFVLPQEIPDRCRQRRSGLRLQVLRVPRRVIFKHGGKMSLSAQLVRPEAERALHALRRFRDPVRSAGRKPRRVHARHGKIRMFFQKTADHALVFLRGKRAGGIYQPSAGTEHLRCRRENLRLTRRAHRDSLLAPVGHGGLFFAEHSLAGAGRIH